MRRNEKFSTGERHVSPALRQRMALSNNNNTGKVRMSNPQYNEMSEETKTGSSEKKYNPKLDFYSDEFDPLLALNTPDLVVPTPTAKIYDNIAKYKSEKERLERGLDPKDQKKIEEKPEFVRKWLPHQLPVQKPAKEKRTVLAIMDDIKGPLRLLTKCRDEKIKVKIFTRNALGVRGYCTGYVVLFDKHWNIVLRDVDEIWTRRKKRKVPALDSAPSSKQPYRKVARPPPVTVIETTDKTETCKRHVEQFLMRGEHIVFICLFPQIKKEMKTEILTDIKTES